MSKKPFFAIALSTAVDDYLFTGRDGKKSLGMSLSEVQRYSDSSAPTTAPHAAAMIGPLPVPRNIIEIIQNGADSAAVFMWFSVNRKGVTARIAEIERYAPVGLAIKVKMQYAGVVWPSQYSRALALLNKLTK